MGNLVEEAQSRPFGRLLDRYHLWYALCLDRSGLGSALQEAYPAIRQKKKTARWGGFFLVWMFFAGKIKLFASILHDG